MNNNNETSKEQIQIGGKTMRVKSKLSKHQFKDLYTFLTIIKPAFQDFSIVQGQFRSRDNDSLSIVETTFRCFDHMDFVIGDIKSVTKKLSCLAKASNITVATDDTSVIFSDGHYTIPLDNLSKDDSINQFIASDEMNRIWDDQIDSDNPLVKETLPQLVVSRMFKVSRKFGTHAIILKHETGNLTKGNLHIEQRTGYAAELTCEHTNIKPIDFLTPIKEGAVIRIPRFSYAFNKSDLILEIYLCKNPEMVGIKHTAKVGTLFVLTYNHSLYSSEKGQDQSR